MSACRYVFLFFILLSPLASTAVEQEAVAVDYRNGTFFATLSINVAVPPVVALAVLTDFEHMPEFMPGLTSSEILERNGRSFRVRQRGRVDFGPFHMNYESERLIEVVSNSRILSRSVAGAANQTRSEMQLSPQADATRIDYHVEILSSGWMPSVFGSNFFQHELAEQFSALEKEMLRRRSRP